MLLPANVGALSFTGCFLTTPEFLDGMMEEYRGRIYSYLHVKCLCACRWEDASGAYLPARATPIDMPVKPLRYRRGGGGAVATHTVHTFFRPTCSTPPAL